MSRAMNNTVARGTVAATALRRDYDARAAAMRSARGALSRHGKRLTKELAKLRRERSRAIPRVKGR